MYKVYKLKKRNDRIETAWIKRVLEVFCKELFYKTINSILQGMFDYIKFWWEIQVINDIPVHALQWISFMSPYNLNIWACLWFSKNWTDNINSSNSVGIW